MLRSNMEKSLFYKVLEIAKQEKFVNHQTVKDLVNLAKNELKRDFRHGLVYTEHLKRLVDKQMKTATVNKSFFYDTFFQILVAETPYSLDSFFQALEWNRPIEQAFYLPRRKQLLPIVKDLERLLIYDEIDELFLSQPPRTGKTTLVLFTLAWFIGLHPEKANLYISCASHLTNSFYNGVMTILTDEVTYLWRKIFPFVKFDKLTMCNAKECYLDTGSKKRYHSFTGKSIDAESINGMCDCDGILICDDLVSGLQEALNKERLGLLNMKVNTDVISRAKMGAKKLWIGTRWSIADPIGRRIEVIASTSIRYCIHSRPALDKNDESNYDYLYNKGYTTQHYIDLRNVYDQNGDRASFDAIYQQEPIERSGLLFPMDELNYFEGKLPEGTPDRIFGFCDPAFGGGDFTSFPIIYKFGNELYCPDWVFDDGDKKITEPKVAHAIYKHQMTAVRFEQDNGGEDYKDDVIELLKSKYSYVPNITAIRAVKVQQKGAESKQIHIFDRAPDIREIFFLDPKYQNEDYKKAMRQLTSYTIQGNARKKKDDAPDSLAKTIDMDRVVEQKTTIKIVPRIF